MASDLPALIARVEAATGPDRELDAEIALATGWERGEAGAFWREPGTRLWSGYYPNPTASLDAAVSLVLEGWRFVGLTYVPIRRQWHCTLEAPDGGLVHGAAKTEQHARTAAALRAWQAQEGKGHG